MGAQNRIASASQKRHAFHQQGTLFSPDDKSPVDSPGIKIYPTQDYGSIPKGAGAMRITDTFYHTQTMDNSPFERSSGNHQSLHRGESVITETPQNEKQYKAHARLNKDVAHLYYQPQKGQTTPSEQRESYKMSQSRGIKKVAVVQRGPKEPNQPSTFRAAVENLQAAQIENDENKNTQNTNISQNGLMRKSKGSSPDQPVNLVVTQNRPMSAANYRRLKKSKKRAKKKRGEVELVVMNNKVMSAAAGVTSQGAASLYNNGFFPKKGGMVTQSSTFGRIGKAHKLYREVDRIVECKEDQAIDTLLEGQPKGMNSQRPTQITSYLVASPIDAAWAQPSVQVGASSIHNSNISQAALPLTGVANRGEHQITKGAESIGVPPHFVDSRSYSVELAPINQNTPEQAALHSFQVGNTSQSLEGTDNKANESREASDRDFTMLSPMIYDEATSAPNQTGAGEQNNQKAPLQKTRPQSSQPLSYHRPQLATQSRARPKAQVHQMSAMLIQTDLAETTTRQQVTTTDQLAKVLRLTRSGSLRQEISSNATGRPVSGMVSQKRPKSGLVTGRMRQQLQSSFAKNGNVAELGKDLIIHQISLKRISSAGFDHKDRIAALAHLQASIDSAYQVQFASLKNMHSNTHRLAVTDNERPRPTLSEHTLNQTERNQIIYSLEQIVEPKHEEWIEEVKAGEIQTGRANGQVSFLPTRPNSDQVHINMRTSRTNVDGKRKVKHMIEITRTEQAQGATTRRPDGSARKERQSRAYSFKQQAKSLLSLDDKLAGNAEKDEVGTVHAGSSQQKQSEGSDLDRNPPIKPHKTNRSLRVFNPRNKLNSSFNLSPDPTLMEPQHQRYQTKLDLPSKESLEKQLSRSKQKRSKSRMVELSQLVETQELQPETEKPEVIYRIPSTLIVSDQMKIENNELVFDTVNTDKVMNLSLNQYVVSEDLRESNIASNRILDELAGVVVPLHSFQGGPKILTEHSELSPDLRSQNYNPKYSHYDTAIFNQSQITSNQNITSPIRPANIIEPALEFQLLPAKVDQSLSLKNIPQTERRRESSEIPHPIADERNRYRSVLNIPTSAIKIVTKVKTQQDVLTNSPGQSGSQETRRRAAAVGVGVGTEAIDFEHSCLDMPRTPTDEPNSPQLVKVVHFVDNPVRLQEAIRQKKEQVGRVLKATNLMKQDDLIGLKEHQVIALGRATIPEKTLFRKVPYGAKMELAANPMLIQGSRIFTIKQKYQQLAESCAVYPQFQSERGYQQLVMNQDPKTPPVIKIAQCRESDDPTILLQQSTEKKDPSSYRDVFQSRAQSLKPQTSQSKSPILTVNWKSDNKAEKIKPQRPTQNGQRSGNSSAGLIRVNYPGITQVINESGNGKKKKNKIGQEQPHNYNESNKSQISERTLSPYRPFSQNRYQLKTDQLKHSDSGQGAEPSQVTTNRLQPNLDLAECEVSVDQLDKEVVNVTRNDLQCKHHNQPLVEQSRSKARIMSSTEQQRQVRDSSSPEYIRSYHSSKESLEKVRFQRTQALDELTPTPKHEQIHGTRYSSLSSSKALTKPIAKQRNQDVQTSFKNSSKLLKRSIDGIQIESRPVLESVMRHQTQGDYPIACYVDTKSVTSGRMVNVHQQMRYLPTFGNEAQTLEDIVQTQRRTSTQDDLRESRPIKITGLADDSSDHQEQASNSFEVAVSHQSKAKKAQKMQETNREMVKLQLSKSSLFDRIGAQLQTVTSKQNINSSFLHRPTNAVRPQNQKQVLISSPGFIRNDMQFQRLRPDDNDSFKVQQRLDSRSGVQELRQFHSQREISALLNTSSHLNMLQHNSQLKNEGVFDVQKACHQLKLTRSNRLNQREYSRQMRGINGQAAIDFTLSLAPSSTIETTAKQQMRYTSQPSFSTQRQPLKRPTSSAMPARINQELMAKPGAIVHEAARKARPLTAAHARAMGRPQSGQNHNLTQKLTGTGSETTKNFIFKQREGKSLTSTRLSLTGGAQSVTEATLPRQTYIVRNTSFILHPPIKERATKMLRTNIPGYKNYNTQL